MDRAICGKLSRLVACLIVVQCVLEIFVALSQVTVFVDEVVDHLVLPIFVIIHFFLSQLPETLLFRYLVSLKSLSLEFQLLLFLLIMVAEIESLDIGFSECGCLQCLHHHLSLWPLFLHEL